MSSSRQVRDERPLHSIFLGPAGADFAAVAELLAAQLCELKVKCNVWFSVSWRLHGGYAAVAELLAAQLCKRKAIT